MRYEPIQLAEDIWSLENDFVRCFFLRGSKRCFLIDTGLEGEGLTGFCEEIAGGLPVTVLITHADGDHCGMAHHFQDVRMNPADFDYYRCHSGLSGPRVDFTPVFDGDTFTDGRHTLAAVLIPGHTPGSTAYFEETTGLLFIGDSISTEPVFMFGPGRSIPALLCSLKRLQTCVSFHTACCCHGERTLPASILPDFIAGLEGIMRGEGTRTPGREGFPDGVFTFSCGAASFFCKR